MEAGGVKIPKLIFTVLCGGKSAASRVRFSKMYLIVDLHLKDTKIDALQVYLKLSAAVKKCISSHKQGENGFKAGPHGSYFNANDSIADSFKMMEEIVN